MANLCRAAQLSWQLQETPIRDLPVPFEIAVELLSTCTQLNFYHPRTTVGYIPESWEEYKGLHSQQSVTTIQQRWQEYATAQPLDLPASKVPIWKITDSS